jgi:hypothetical protein
METGVAQEPVNLDDYREQLETRLGKAHGVMRLLIHKAQSNPKRVVFPEGDNDKVLRACHILIEENVATPILLGSKALIEQRRLTLVSNSNACNLLMWSALRNGTLMPASFTKSGNAAESLFPKLARQSAIATCSAALWSAQDTQIF